MNSFSLKKLHHDVYEQFFLENHVVISAPFVMNRSGDVFKNYCGLSIKQQIPLRIYIGYAKNESSDVTLNKIYYQDINEQQFLQGNILEYAPYFHDVQKEIHKQYHHLCETHGGIEINILTELPRGVWLGFGSIVPLLLALLLNRFQDTISPHDIHLWKTQNINNLLQDTYGSFYSFFMDALNLDKHMYGMISPGTKLASFFSSHYPVVSFSEDFDKKTASVNIGEHRFWWFTLPDLFPELREVPYSSIDYGVAYSGKPVFLEQITWDHYRNNANTFKTIKSSLHTLFGEYLQTMDTRKMPRFYKHLLLPEGDEHELIYGKLMGMMSLKIFHAMCTMYRDGYDEHTVLKLLDALQKLRQANCVTRDNSAAFLSFIKHVLEHFTGSAKYFSLFPNDSTIMWGSLIFATPMDGFRKAVLDSFSKTFEDFAWSMLLYANWIDGTEYAGCIVEQDLKYNILSDFLESNNCILRWVNGKILIADCESSLEMHKTGLLLDTLHNKIYLDGERLTSQELHSQSATIEVMRVLIANLGKDMVNTDLPPSSYSKNKNEMMSKIVLPLLDLIERRTGKKLPLICKWSLYTFYMKLNKSDIEIVVVNRLDKEEPTFAIPSIELPGAK